MEAEFSCSGWPSEESGAPLQWEQLQSLMLCWGFSAVCLRDRRAPRVAPALEYCVLHRVIGVWERLSLLYGQQSDVFKSITALE